MSTDTLRSQPPAAAGPRVMPRAAERLFRELLDRHVSDARLRVASASGEAVLGRGTDDAGRPRAPDVGVRVHDAALFARVLTHGNLGLGEGYMEGQFDVEEGTLQDFLTILARNRLDRKIRQSPRLAARILGLRLLHTLRGKQRNVQSHYDIDNRLFETFLDPTLTYSCGYAQTPHDSLEELQAQKLDRICRKLRLAPGQRLLDIGCGFGGLLIHAAQHYGVSGTGVTIARQHVERGNARIAEQGLGGRVRIEFCDHTRISGTFDRVVSVGMLEHVPRREYRRYFANIARVLTDEGMGLVHAIGCISPTNAHDPFIQKYVFPGSNQPKLSEIAAELERNEMPVLDVENIVRHYAPTVQHWLERFRANRHRLDPARYDERFVRMWEYYLCAGIAAARVSNNAVFQVLFMKDYTRPMPLLRV